MLDANAVRMSRFILLTYLFTFLDCLRSHTTIRVVLVEEGSSLQRRTIGWCHFGKRSELSLVRQYDIRI